MKSQLDVVFNTQVKKHLDDFHLSLQQDSAAIASFLGSLSTFNNSLQKHRNKLQQETLVTVRKFGSLLNFLASNLLDLEVKTEAKGKETIADISEILSQEMGKLSIADASTSPKEAVLPAYIEPSHSWLLSNLHNPYPSKDVKKKIARQTNCSVKDIDAWFIDIRKRIGWNALRKSHFSNKQDKIIAAATQTFRPRPLSFAEDSTTTLSSEADIHGIHRPLFLAIQHKARSLYADRFPSLIPLAFADNGVPISSSSVASIPLSSTLISDGALSYPTPEPSTPTYHRDISPPAVHHHHASSSPRSRKRNLDSLYVCDVDNGPALKRLRSSDKDMTTSPISSPLDKKQDKTILQFSVNSSPGNPEISTLKRKRRLSDGENQGPPKRPHNAFCLPRLQTVSDPFPVKRLLSQPTIDPQIFDDTVLESGFNDSIPSPANTHTSISSAMPVNVNLYQYDFSSYDSGVNISSVEVTTPTEDRNAAPALLPHDSIFSSGYESLAVAEPIQVVCLDPIDRSNVQFTIDSPLSSYQLDFDCNQTRDDVGIFTNSDLFSLVPGGIPDTVSLLNNDSVVVDIFQPNSFTSTKAGTVSKFDHTVSQDFADNDDKEARRARARALRQELAQLVAEGL